MKRVVGVVLGCLLALPLTGCFFGGTVMTDSYANAEAYHAGRFEYRAEDVKKLEVNWYCGGVTLKQTEGDTLHVTESGENLSTEEALHWLLEDGVLRVEFCASGYASRFSGQDKKLTVEIPAGLDIEVTSTSAGIAAELGKQKNVTLQTTSGAIEVSGTTDAETLRLGTTSGAIDLEQLTAKSLTAETTSGSVRVQEVNVTESVRLGSTSGSIRAESLNANGGTVAAESNSGSIRLDTVRTGILTVGTTSGGVTVGLNECKNASIQTTSGSVRLNLSQSLGATVHASSTSGSFNGSGYRSENGRYIWGDGACTVSLGTTSGSITVK
ncbi:MAG TPA: hypothetical protein DDW30_09290 [Clostridiales bacterium]|nr:hypothetical protein [Clostridiales bacterium]